MVYFITFCASILKNASTLYKKQFFVRKYPAFLRWNCKRTVIKPVTCKTLETTEK